MDKENENNELQKIIDEIIPIIRELENDETSKIAVLESEIDKYGTKTVTLCGGLNGSGEWKNYFSDLSQICDTLAEKGFDMWLIKLDNDCLDDIFYATFGISRKNG